MTATRIAGLLVAALGAVLAIHWWLDVEAISRLVPGSSAIGLANPLLFLAAAVCFLDADLAHETRGRRAWRRAATVCIAALIALPLAHLAETITGTALGVDFPRPGVVASALNRHPGRLSPNGSVAFILTGLAFLLLRRPFARLRWAACAGATLGVAFIGLAGLAGHFLGLETLYKLANANRLLPTTAFGLSIVGAGLWALLERARSFDVAEAEQRIKNRSLAVIALVALGSGIAGFAIMRDTFEQTVSKNLRLTASTNAASLAHALEFGLWLPRTVATRPSVRQALAQLKRQADDAPSLDVLRGAAASFGETLLRAEFRDADGALLTSVGGAARETGHALALSSADGPARMAWRNGFVLVSDVAIEDQGRLVGRLVSEQRLPLFDRLLRELHSVSATSEASICGRRDALALCAPTPARPAWIEFALPGTDGTMALAIGQALRGESGVQFARDPRGSELLAAYAPIPDSGLALGVATETAALYAPLRQRVALLAAALAAMVALAIYAQRSQVQPALRRLAQSERRIKSILEEQTELVSLARPDGILTYANAAYARHFGRTPGQMVNTSLFDYIDAADVERVRADIASVLRSGHALTVENRMVRPEGGVSWVSWSNSPQRTREGEVLLHSVGRDVTERRLTEERLASSERFLRQVTDSLPALIAYADAERRHGFANKALCRHLGLPRERILGRTRGELVATPADAQFSAAAAAVLAGREQRFEVDEQAGDRALRVEYRLIPDIADDGAARGFYAIGIDVTERSAAERALRDLATVFDNTTDYVVQTDWRGRIHYMNPAVRRALGIAPDAPVDSFDFGQFNTPETNRRFAETIVPVAKAEGVWIGETTVFVANRREVHVNQMVIAHKGPEGRVNLYSSIMRDITDELAVQREQQRQAATLRSVAEAIPAIVAVVGRDGRCRFVNSAFERWSGMDRGSIVGHALDEVVGPEEHARIQAWIERALAGETVSFEREYAEPAAIRHLALNYIPLRLDGDEVDGFVAVGLDVTRHRQENVRLLQLAQRDPLTGLLNRSGFEAWLQQHGGTRSLALLYIDLDRFKQVNDTQGHAVGDQLLQQFAQRLQGLVRPTDAVARLGGDEFAVALAGIRDGAHADAVAEKVVAAAHSRFQVAGLDLEIGASVGVALGTEAAGGWRELIARADTMLYRAKAGGRGRHASLAQQARR